MSDPFPYQHEPLPDAERTVVRPRPGARSSTLGRSTLDSDLADALAIEEPAGSPTLPRNPLLACAQPLLSLVPQIRAVASQPDPSALRESLASGVGDFERAAQKAGISRETIIAARYILCTFLDETASSTPWGSGGVWASDTLLVRFHNETWGGEKVFALLSKLAENPARNRDLLELVYYCLALGFQGRYGAMPNGRAELGQVRERLYQMLSGLRPEPEQSLSPRWAPAVVIRKRWLSAAPFWAFCAISGFAALATYLGYSGRLGARSDPVFASIQAIRLPSVAPVRQVPAASVSRLAPFLESDVRNKQVTVRDEPTQSVVDILGDGLFEPGSTEVPASKRALIERIGKALAANPGRVLVSGHTDNLPIRSARFPSNWDLSRERARAVQRILSETVDPSRIEAEGRADSEPIAPNDTAAGRARNRRVEVTLYAGSG